MRIIWCANISEEIPLDCHQPQIWGSSTQQSHYPHTSRGRRSRQWGLRLLMTLSSINSTPTIAAYWGQRPLQQDKAAAFSGLPPGGDKSMAPCQQTANNWEESVSHPRLTSGLRHSPEPMAIPSSLAKEHWILCIYPGTLLSPLWVPSIYPLTSPSCPPD